MMWNPLLHWMAHVGRGTWGGFKRAISSLATSEIEVAEEARRLRTRFSDLAYAEFFIGGGEHWQAFQPLLASSPHQPEEAFLCGARTSRTVTDLRVAADRTGCKFFELWVDNFTTIRLMGKHVAAAAKAAGLLYEPDISRRLANDLAPLEETIRSGFRTVPPQTWKVRSFDFEVMGWVDGFLPGAATEYVSIYEQRRYFLQTASESIELPKREAIFAAAAIGRVQVVQYDATQQELRVALKAPLPQSYARAACAAVGRASIRRADQIVYERVPPQLAAVIMVGLGQTPPPFHLCEENTAGRRR